jgi:4-hydroxybenzoate polyprenyltransferase
MLKKLRIVLRMIKIEHSVFALPFAILSALVAANGIPSWSTLFWIFVAMISARSCAMAFNRVADSRFDALNPRTKNWALPAGLLTKRFVILFILVSSVIFIYAAFRLNSLAFLLSPLALAILFFYSLTKRFTPLSHWFIGLALGIAPAGAWIAVRGSLEMLPIWLGLAILFWTAGFDLIYSCQDAEFDRNQKLHSIPSRFGVAAALILSRICHVCALLLLGLFGLKAGLGAWYFSGVALVTILLIYEHTLVAPNNLSRVNEAFFTVNGLVSVLLLLFSSLDLYL